jgi:hypothetical protein
MADIMLHDTYFVGDWTTGPVVLLACALLVLIAAIVIKLRWR